jgi:hypothetical protein
MNDESQAAFNSSFIIPHSSFAFLSFFRRGGRLLSVGGL